MSKKHKRREALRLGKKDMSFAEIMQATGACRADDCDKCLLNGGPIAGWFPEDVPFRADWPRAFFSGRIWTRSDWCLVSQCSRRLRPHFVKQRVYPAFQASQLKKHQHAQRNPLQCGSKLQNLNDHFLLLLSLPVLLGSIGTGAAKRASRRHFSRLRYVASPACRRPGSGRHGRYHPSATNSRCGAAASPRF